MQKINSFSKYQKDIIKKIGKELGPNTPFKYEKTSSNHLKVFIDGLDKPRYTACTPSDQKSGDNFMADLRGALKAARVKRQPKMVVSQPMNLHKAKAQYIEHLMSACIKAVRTNIQQYSEKDRLWVMKENSITHLKTHRKNMAAKIFEQTQKSQRNQQYVTGCDSRIIKGEIFKHLSYMLPNTADYADVLHPNKIRNELSKAVNVATGSIELSNVKAANEGVNELKKGINIVSDFLMGDSSAVDDICAEPSKPLVKKERVKKERVKKEDQTLARTPSNEEKVRGSLPNKNPAETLAAMNKSQAIQHLRCLSRHEGEAMLECIQIAMAENHQQDLQEVLSMMSDKGITLDMLSSSLNKSA